MSRELKCVVCGGLIEGHVHVEPEGCYHPECFLKTPRAAKLAALRTIEESVKDEVARDIAAIVARIRSRFDGLIREHGIKDDEILAIISRIVMRSWASSG